MTRPPPPQADASTRGRVLVVEDDVHIRDLVVLHLQLEGLTPVAVGDGTTGLDIRATTSHGDITAHSL